MKNAAQKLLVGLGVAGASIAPAMAQTAPDYSTITSAVSIGAVVTGIIAMGAIKILPNVAKWASNKLASFFG